MYPKELAVEPAAEKPIVNAEVGQAGPEPTEGVEGDQPLTRAEFAALEERLTSQVTRAIQSRTDKADHRLQQKFQSLMGPYTRAAKVAVDRGLIPATAQAAFAQSLRDDAINHAFETDAPVQPNTANAAGPDERQAGEPQQLSSVDLEDVNVQGEQLAQSLGLAEGDPELAGVIPDGTPEEYLASIRVAARIKAARTSAAGNSGTGAAGQPARAAAGRASAAGGAARSPAAGAGSGQPSKINPIANIDSAEDLYAMEWNRMRQTGR